MLANSEVPANASAATDNRNPALIMSPAFKNVEPLQVLGRKLSRHKVRTASLRLATAVRVQARFNATLLVVAATHAAAPVAAGAAMPVATGTAVPSATRAAMPVATRAALPSATRAAMPVATRAALPRATGAAPSAASAADAAATKSAVVKARAAMPTVMDEELTMSVEEA